MIPAGHFLMGSVGDEGQDDEHPVHAVAVSAFECAVYAVTQAEYAEFLDATGHDEPKDWRTSKPVRPATDVGRNDLVGRTDLEVRQANLPVTGVSWLDAVAFCAWRAENGDPMRLPTEAEWEYAARGGLSGAQYAWGDEIPTWIPAAGRGPLEAPWPVGLGEPNGFGIYGIGANIHEWCADWHAATYYAESPLRNPAGPPSGMRRASRGGAWRHAVTISRCAQRSKLDPSFRYTDYGFRVVR